MKLYSLILLILPLNIEAQPVSTIPTPDSITEMPGNIADKEPPFICGGGEIMPEAPFDIPAYLSSHIVLPKDALEQGFEGRIMVKFLVTEEGMIDSVSVPKSRYPSLDREAARVVKAMPCWKPARRNGKPVRCYYMLPVIICLE